MADAEAVMAAVPRRDDVTYIGLVLNRRGFDRALAAGVDEVNCVVVASETFSQRNQGMSVADSVEIVRELADLGVDEIAIADTIGVGVPAQVRRLLAGLADVAPNARTRAHFHNTRNTGYANAIAALESGVTSLDSSTGGIGGCPFAPAATGNIATEDLVYLLDRSGVETGVDLGQVV